MSMRDLVYRFAVRSNVARHYELDPRLSPGTWAAVRAEPSENAVVFTTKASTRNSAVEPLRVSRRVSFWVSSCWQKR
jgi:hypothetical protein